jgi:hypothetical protein
MSKGRRTISQLAKRKIANRLEDLIGDRGGAAKFGSTYGFSLRSVQYWLGGDSAMDTAAVLQLAEEARVSPNWLLLGHGQRELTDAPEGVPTIRDGLIHTVSMGLGIRPEFTAYVLPAEAELLEEFARATMDTVRQKLEEKRKWQREERRKRRARLGIDDAEDPAELELKRRTRAQLIAFITDQDEKLREMPSPDIESSQLRGVTRVLGSSPPPNRSSTRDQKLSKARSGRRHGKRTG